MVEQRPHDFYARLFVGLLFLALSVPTRRTYGVKAVLIRAEQSERTIYTERERERKKKACAPL